MKRVNPILQLPNFFDVSQNQGYYPVVNPGFPQLTYFSLKQIYRLLD